MQDRLLQIHDEADSEDSVDIPNFFGACSIVSGVLSMCEAFSGFTLFIKSSNLTFLLALHPGGSKLRLGNFNWSFMFIGYAHSPMQVYRYVQVYEGIEQIRVTNTVTVSAGENYI